MDSHFVFYSVLFVAKYQRLRATAIRSLLLELETHNFIPTILFLLDKIHTELECLVTLYSKVHQSLMFQTYESG
jgi:hypothetical protein